MKENIIKEIANYNIEEDIEKAFPNVWRDLTDGKNIISQSSPISILLGGQPGAGKSLATMQIKERLNNNVLVINGDEFRSYHKHYDDFYQLYGKDASKHTRDFAGKMVAKVRDRAIQERFNIVIEGTFRSVDVPLKELENFNNQGYKSEVVICTCPKELSWQSTLKRAEELEKAGMQPRYVPKEHHDLVTEVLAKNVKAIYDTRLVSNLEIYSREKQLFHSQKDSPNKIEQVINNELNGLNQKKNLANLFSEEFKVASQKVNEKRSQSISIENHSINNRIKL